MTQQDIRELAKQGNPKALATLINQSLKPKNITAKVGVKDDCIQVLLESTQVPDQQVMVSFIRKGLIKLEVPINNVKVYGRRIGEETPAWNQTFELIPVQDTSVITEEIKEPIISHIEPVKEIEEPIYSPTPPLDDMENSVISTASTRKNLPNTSVRSQNSTPRQTSEPLTVGNVVSAALRIYRDRFKLYWRLAFIAWLWSIIPIYGWAKSSAITAIIARLAYGEVIERPESLDEASDPIMSRMWSFLWAGFLVGLIFWASLFVGFFILVVLWAVLVPIAVQNSGVFLLLIPLVIITSIAFLIGCIRLISRLFIFDLPLAMEENVTEVSSIKRSLQLTKGFTSRLQWIILVAFLIASPLYLVVQLVSGMLQIVLAALLGTDSLIFGLLNFLLVIAVSIVVTSIFVPFWQSIKAVIYYDLRSRREGLGLQLRDSR